MNKVVRWGLPLVTCLAWPAAHADMPPVAAADQAALLRSSDSQLAANKRLVYDVIRTVMIAGHVELVDRYMAPTYVQHNPLIPSGRDAFVAFIKRLKPTPAAISDTVAWPLVTMVAERDLVTVAMVREVPDPRNPSATLQTTWFDMYRVKDGRIVEHWDGSAGEHARPPKK